MALASAPFFTESFDLQLNNLLLRICAELQLDETRYKLAEERYKAVHRWLEVPGTLVANFRPLIYPQGSMKLNTTVRPLKGDEFDLDFVCELVVDPRVVTDPLSLLRLVERRLRENATYNAMLQLKNRCVRLNYAHEFHMDILPGCHDPNNGGTCIVVPDRAARSWKASNPKGFAEWFERRAAFTSPRRALLARAEPIPDQEAMDEKPPLKLTVQLIKRARDIAYASTPELSPISIVLTSLAGYTYTGQGSVAEAMDGVLAGIVAGIDRAYPKRLVVPNPSNKDEDLSERWDTDRTAYMAFVEGIRQFAAGWRQLRSESGLKNVAKNLERLFGEQLSQTVIEKQARDIEAARTGQQITVKKSSGVIAGIAASAAVHVPRNTFYGEEE